VTEIHPPPIDKYRPDIDGLRAVAVLSVVLYPAFPQVVRGGFVGVDIFFVISGFLISSILFAEFAHRRFSLAAFYGRRIRRIFPALSLCLAAVLAYGFVCLMPSELAQLGKHLFFGAGFLSNIALWSETGYFDGAASLKPLLHLWSLGVEEQFYILWPAMLWLSFRWRAQVGRLLVGMFLASFIVNIALSMHNISDDFYLPVSRFWELLAGAALAWRGGKLALTDKSRNALSWAGLAALLLAVGAFSAQMRFPGWPALLPVAGAVAVILAGPKAAANRLIFAHPAAVWVGLISYPLYIWHWPLLSFAHVIRLGREPTPLMAVGLVAAAILLAWGTYRFIEQPVRFGRHRRGWTVGLAVLVALLGAGGAGVWARGGFPERFPPMPGIDVQKISAASTDVIFKPTAGMTVEDHDKTLIARLGSGPRKVVLSGDSLLFHYGPRVQELSDEGRLDAQVIFVTGASCAPLPGLVQKDNFAHCAQMPDLLRQVVAKEKPQNLVLGASWLGYGSPGVEVERNGQRFSMTTDEGKDAFWANLADFIRSFQAEGVTVYLVRGVAGHGRFNPHEMVSRTLTSFQVAPDAAREQQVSEMRKTHAQVDARLAQVAAETHVQLLDTFPDICGTGETCSGFFDQGEPKFTDGMHLRPVFVKDHIRFLDFLLTDQR